MALKEINRIISEVNGLNEKERMILLKKIEDLYAIPDKDAEEDDPLQAVFGLWKDYDINKETLRAKAWVKN
ncbi:hypothetical protein FACS1894172_08800 [Spirochaetia bacterium]|nr:hypothetical protein FACS1894164_12280 [Spirochaetia bacterium]GHU32346.1 hypothetical protein FACS1894172_08800 [Spirochaetia bacterium]